MIRAAFLLLLAGLCLFAFRGTIADWLWPNSAAPWEEVDAFYYPKKTNLPVDKRAYGLASVENCRQWVFQKAALNGDPRLEDGDYECGVGFMRNVGDLRMYRLTLQ